MLVTEYANNLFLGKLEVKDTEQIRAEEIEYEKEQQAEALDKHVLSRYRWISVELVNKEERYKNVRLDTLKNYQKHQLKFTVGQHINAGFHVEEKTASRP